MAEAPSKNTPSRIAYVQQKDSSRPRLLSAEGILMLLYAIILDGVNIIWGILDFLVVGIALGFLWNAIAFCTLGVWLWIKTGQSIKTTRRKKRLTLQLVKRVGIPVLGNWIPLAKFFPFWVWSVWGTLEKGAAPQGEESQEIIYAQQLEPSPA